MIYTHIILCAGFLPMSSFTKKFIVQTHELRAQFRFRETVGYQDYNMYSIALCNRVVDILIGCMNEKCLPATLCSMYIWRSQDNNWRKL